VNGIDMSDDQQSPPEPSEQSEQPEQDRGEIAKADPRGRALLAGAVIFALGLVAAFQFAMLPLMNSAASKAAPLQAIAMVKAILVAAAGLGAITAFIWIVYARRILRHRQDPPPGAWLWRDTKIVRGEAAVRRAWMSIAAALVMCAVCIGITVYIAIKLDRFAVLMHPSNSPPVVTQIMPILPAEPKQR
jgi:formate hydrogenlyase subunit 3/multisubunit Na+/H+ antiporter MnhD subunit